MEIRDRIQALMLLVGLMVIVGCFFSLQSDSTVSIDSVKEPARTAITSNYEYDEANRLTAIHYSDGYHVEFIYDNSGALVERREYHDKDVASTSQQIIVNLTNEEI